MLDTPIRLGDLGILLLGAALLVLIIYAISILKNLNETMKILRKIVEDNEANIKKVLDKAPAIAENIESISGDLSHDVKAVQGTIDRFVGTTEAAAGALAENTDVLTGIIGIIQVLMVIKDFLSGFYRKRRWF
ncbi:DUF948 domain-containing protein [Thermotalea metallivorans]|uniref:DUF948 domain-containing protein n=1 Tax=Thermotalea metallivorans TaxID=520762 RepID=A0A140L0S8_9FIRM|nr:DUF948 domain-containing protein [Thermotalea metallivorans]KXG74153.1 hypothetical protein AN619_25720 [Thermotalea metallivorans]